MRTPLCWAAPLTALALGIGWFAWTVDDAEPPDAVRDSSDVVSIPEVVTSDIRAGIEAYIAREAARHGGLFPLPYDGTTLNLKLVRVHLEYLSNLGPRRHFACVDMAAEDGTVYDVDFFLSGDPGSMEVTELTVHKINGQPFYSWEQQDDHTWTKVPAESASRALLGVKEGQDHFEFLYLCRLPTLDAASRMWIPLPASDEYQQIEVRSIVAPSAHTTLTDARYGNQVLFLEFTAEDSGKDVALRFEVRRTEKGVHADDADAAQGFLADERLVRVDEDFKALAASVTEGKEQNDLTRARALYDHTIDSFKYMKYGEGWGKGDAKRASKASSGNCTDYHAYFIALARASGIPARFGIGAAVPSDRDSGGVDGYHCWAEFYADGKWWPVDISEADKYTALSTYYFGRNPANRVEFSRGRDLVVDPGPASGPINFLAYPVLEVGGKPVDVKPQFGFTRLEPVPAARASPSAP